MKNKFLLFPLIAALITCSACSTPKGGKKKGSGADTSATEVDPGDSDPSDELIHYAGTVEKGENHAVPWALSYEDFKDASGALSYLAFNKTYTFNGTNIYAYGMRAVTDIAVSIGGALIPYKNLKNIHLCAYGHASWPDGGQLQISDVKSSKLTLELINHSSKTFSDITVYSGGKRITPEKDAVISVSALNEEFNIKTVVYNINASEAEMVKIFNQNKRSVYIQSIQFE